MTDNVVAFPHPARPPQPVIIGHLAATQARFIQVHGRLPTTLALGRWDARELARWVAAGTSLTGSQFLRMARGGITVGAGIQAKVDGRIQRMPGALWWA